MKRTWTILLAGLLIAALTAPALAWEFDMTGEAEFRYRYFARQGQADLFGGPLGLNGALGATGTNGFAGPVDNLVRVQGFSAKGGDASIGDNRIWLFPDIRVNPAIRLRGEYWVTGTNLRGLYDGAGAGTGYPADNWSVPLGYTGWYIANDGTTGNRTTPTGMSVGQWEKFWLTAQTPWGVFAIGRRPFPFGLGWSVANERDASSESILIAAPYGPLTLGGYIHNRSAGNDMFCENAFSLQNSISGTTGAVTPLPLVQARGTDKNPIKAWDMGPYIVYRDGPVEFGFFQEWVSFKNVHTSLAIGVPAGPIGADDPNNSALPASFLGGGIALNGAQPITGDIDFVIGINYFKYFNGRFFLNAEYNYEYANVPKRGGRPITQWAEAWMGEVGAICGPSKFSLAAFRSSGHDRRGGVLNVTNPLGGVGNLGGAQVFDWFNLFLPFSSREIVTLPYVWLAGIYGTGNNSFAGNGKPNFQDFLAYAARLDYAVAANLNIYATYMYMNRDSNTATPIGNYRGGVPNVATAGLAITPVRVHPGFLGLGSAQSAPVPNVPDNYLGWEADLGLNWKLLENMTFNALFAYWQPGDWFKWAYVDYGSLTTTTVSGMTMPVNPNRGIDPLIGFQCSVLVDF